MEKISFIFTIFFMLLGPIKIIPAFAGLTQGSESQFKKALAIRGALIASAIGVFVALVGVNLVGKYRISIDAVRIGGGLVLLLAALNIIFKKPQPSTSSTGTPTAIQLAVLPVAIPIIITPAGIAAILIFMMLAPKYPGITHAVFICLAIVMVLDFIVMYLIDKVVKMPGLMLILQTLGSILGFIQVSLAIETILVSLRNLGVIQDLNSL